MAASTEQTGIIASKRQTGIIASMNVSGKQIGTVQ
jgi:hypothetical protein